jgi:hypothetical protein
MLVQRARCARAPDLGDGRPWRAAEARTGSPTHRADTIPGANITPQIMLSVGKEKRTLLKFDHHWGIGLMTAEPNEGLYWGFTFSCEVTLVMQ